MKYLLQNRWKIKEIEGMQKLVYYGLRNWPKNKKQIIPLSDDEVSLLTKLQKPTELNATQRELLESFIEDAIVVLEKDYKHDSTKENYQSCVRCINNDYVIPGLEFDENGLCAFCQCYENEKPENLKSSMTIEDEELIKNIKERKDKNANYDVMVFFTGGKDSTYLVWHLSKNLGLKVLAACWDMPFTNESSRKNMYKVLDSLPNVELIQWRLSKETFENAVKKQYETMGLFCLCPAPAYPLFYPIAKMHNIPYIMWGMEDVQASVMEYVFPAPQPQLLDERTQTLQVLKGRALPGKILEPITWNSEIHNYHTSLQDIFKSQLGPLQQIIKEAQEDDSMPIPIIKRLKTKDAYGSWDDIVEILNKEVGWEMPANQKNKLHTSCVIENVKDYTQFLKFKNMETVFFPQAIVELSAAIVFGHITREDALEQMDELGFFEPPKMYKYLVEKTTGKKVE